MPIKQPISALIVIHTPDLQVLLLERADYPGSWQSVTGSREGDETLWQTAVREVGEETGFVANADNLRDWQQQNRYEIYHKWRHRYPHSCGNDYDDCYVPLYRCHRGRYFSSGLVSTGYSVFRLRWHVVDAEHQLAAGLCRLVVWCDGGRWKSP